MAREPDERDFQVAARKAEGLSYSEIARELGMSKPGVQRSLARVAEHAPPEPVCAECAENTEPQCAEDTAPEVTDDLDSGWDAETRAMMASFDIATVPAELVERLDGMGVDLTQPESVWVMLALTEDPTDELNLYRIAHLPRTAQWWAGRDALGRLISTGAADWAQLDADW